MKMLETSCKCLRRYRVQAPEGFFKKMHERDNLWVNLLRSRLTFAKKTNINPQPMRSAINHAPLQPSLTKREQKPLDGINHAA